MLTPKLTAELFRQLSPEAQVRLYERLSKAYSEVFGRISMGFERWGESVVDAQLWCHALLERELGEEMRKLISMEQEKARNMRRAEAEAALQVEGDRIAEAHSSLDPRAISEIFDVKPHEAAFSVAELLPEPKRFSVDWWKRKLGFSTMKAKGVYVQKGVVEVGKIDWPMPGQNEVGVFSNDRGDGISN